MEHFYFFFVFLGEGDVFVSDSFAVFFHFGGEAGLLTDLFVEFFDDFLKPLLFLFGLFGEGAVFVA